jgi:hypothetical protein
MAASRSRRSKPIPGCSAGDPGRKAACRRVSTLQCRPRRRRKAASSTRTPASEPGRAWALVSLLSGIAGFP